MPTKKKDEADELGLLSRADVAKLFRVSTKTVTRRVQARLLPRPMRGLNLWTLKSLQQHILRFEEETLADRSPKKAAIKIIKNKKMSNIQGTSLAKPSPQTMREVKRIAKARRNGRRQARDG